MLDFDAYLDALASAAPTPGGGSAATLVGAMGAALVAMVARISADAPRLAAKRADALEIARLADELRAQLLAAREADESAYAAVVAASALPKGSEAERAVRSPKLQHALACAAEAPLAASQLASDGTALALRAAALGNKHLASDIECSLAFFRAARAASSANVRINHRFMTDVEVKESQRTRLSALERTADRDDAAAMIAIGDGP